MQTITVTDNQTILDVALKCYGTAEALGEIIRNNPGLKNDPAALVKEGRAIGSFYPDAKLATGQSVLIDDDSRLMKKNVIKNIDKDITTYMDKSWQER